MNLSSLPLSLWTLLELSVLIVAWHWEHLYPLLLARAAFWRRGGGKRVPYWLYHGEEISLFQKTSSWNRCWKNCLLDWLSADAVKLKPSEKVQTVLSDVIDIAHSRVKGKAFFGDKTFFLLPSLTTTLSCIQANRACRGIYSVSIVSWDIPVMESSSHVL